MAALRDDHVTPELVLIDPDLARRARALLPAPGNADALRTPGYDARPSSAGEDVAWPTATATDRPGRWFEGIAHRRYLVVLAALMPVLMIGGLSAASSPSPATADQLAHGAMPTPASDSESEATRPPLASGSPRASPLPTAATPLNPPAGTNRSTATRRLAWAPVKGAIAYKLALFAGGDLVYEAETAKPTIILRVNSHGGRRGASITPGTYRWYVWPITKAGRAPKASVQAILRIQPI
jgi:hypothetical protein